MQTLRLVYFVILICFSSIQCIAQDVEGHWEGYIDIMGDQLEVQVDFDNSADSLTGEITIPAQNLRDLPLTDIDISPDSAIFRIKGVGGAPTFIGAIHSVDRVMKGIFRQYGQDFTFELRKAAAPSAKSLSSLDGLDTVIENNMAFYRVPGLAIAIVVDGALIYEKGFGYRDVERQIPVTPQTLFAIGSSTKAFTTFTISALIDEGKLEWDQPVKQYIPWFQMSEDYLTDYLTVRDLVTHRSGLPRHDLLWYNNDSYNRKDLVRSLRYLEASAGLRERFQYNNLMYLTAGYLIEHETENSWEANVREHVFSPLSMERSNFSVQQSKRDPNHARPYKEEGDTLREIPFRDITTIGPAGSINSTIEDMSRWIRMQLNRGTWQNKELVNGALIDEMHRPQIPTGSDNPRPEISARSYGLGWFVDTWRGHKRVEHGGNIDGFSALVTLFPDDDIGMVILTNKNGSALPSSLSQHIADRLFELESISWLEKGLKEKNQAYTAMEKAGDKKEAARKKGTELSHDLTDYAGTYHHPGYGTVTFEKEGDSLYMLYNDIRTSLVHWHYDVFNGNHSPDPVFENMKIKFKSNLDGYISDVDIPMEQSVSSIEFEKKPDKKWFTPAFLERFTGDYNLMGNTVNVRRVGESLRVSIPGQGEMKLVPVLGDQFELEAAPNIQILFEKRDENNYTMIIDQPQGRFEAQPVEK